MKAWLKTRLKPLVDFKETPHELGLAFGFGVFLGIIPGTGAIAAAACAAFLRLNLPLMVAGALLTNPVTTPFVYGASYLIGKRVLGSFVPAWSGFRIVLQTLTGNLILAVGLGLVGYLVIFCFVGLLRLRRGSSYPA